MAHSSAIHPLAKRGKTRMLLTEVLRRWAVLTVESELGLTITTATCAGRLSTVWVPRSAIRLVADAAGRVASEATS